MKPALPAVLAATLASAGCLMGPNYQRPAVPTPPAYRGGTPMAGASFGGEKWFDAFQDPVLQQLIRTALANNYTVRIAAASVLAAQQQATIAHAEEFPEATANVAGEDAEFPKVNSIFPYYSEHYGGLDLSVLWNLDFWGRYRRASEAARDQLLATEWGQKEAMSSLVAQVAEAYFQLLEYDDALDTSRRTLAARQDALKLTAALTQYGTDSQLDLNEAQELEAQAAEAIPALESQIATQENMLATLLGENPQAIPRGLPIDKQPNPPAVPAGLPSELLERRPDIREAEANLMAANAQIGEARAAMFPSVALTATGGVESYALNQLFQPPGRQWSLQGNASQVIFAAGSLRAAVRLSQAQEQEMLLTYLQTIQQAFAQVADALVALQKDHEYRQQQEQLTRAADQAEQLSEVLFRNGGASYLQVLTADTNAFTAELNLAQAEANERLALVQLYNALGGGWQ